jgi:hypothetical protein
MSPFQNMFYFMKKPWVMALYLILMILVYHYADRDIALYLKQHNVRGEILFLSFLTLFGKPPIYMGLFTILGLYWLTL